MPGPETLRAVVRVAVAADGPVAVGAAEVFACAREAPRQKAPRFVEPNGARRGDPWAGSPTRARASGRRSRYLLRSGYVSGGTWRVDLTARTAAAMLSSAGSIASSTKRD